MTSGSRCSRISSFVLATAMVFAAVAASLASAHRAAADPLSDAKAKAAALQAQVAQLQTQAEQASEKYDATEAALGALVIEQRQAEEQQAAAQRTLDAKRAIVEQRASALYMSGGTLGLYAALVQGNDPGVMATGLHDIAAISDADRQVLAGIDAAAQTAAQAQAHVDALLQRQTALMAQASSAANDVDAALDRQQQALAQAGDQVRTIEQQIQAQIEAQAAARAQAALLAAQQAAFAGGLVAGQGGPSAQAAIAAASTQLGKPYVYGGSGPDVWDCSGLTQWAYRQAGVSLPRTAAQQYLAVPTKVPLGELRPGDLLFWATDLSDPASIHHVAIYLGNGRMLAAPHTGTVVQIQPVYLDGYFGAVRPS